MTNINLLEAIEHSLGLPPLKKIDPNTQEVHENSVQSDTEKLNQAAVTAVMAGLYLFATFKEGAEAILGGNKSTDWVGTVFKGRKQDAVRRVAAYAGVPEEKAAAQMDLVAREAVRITGEQVQGDPLPNEVNEFFTQQRDKILQYLPAALQMGQLLKDDTLDDRTNKMRGPVSGFMHIVEKVFSSGTKDTQPGLF